MPRATVAQNIAGAKTFPPFSDASVMLDMTMTSAAAIAAAGFSLNGTGHTFDPVLGFNGNGTGCVQNTAFRSGTRATDFAANKFTLYLEVRRRDLAKDFRHDTSNFVDQTGQTNTALANIFQCNKSAANNNLITIQVLSTGSAPPAGGNLLFSVKGNVGSSQNSTQHRFAADYVRGYEDDYAKIVITGSGNTIDYYLDGKLMWSITDANGFVIPDMFERVSFGAVAALGNPWAGYIRRVQLSNVYSKIYPQGMKVGVIGDSFCVRGTNRAEPAGFPANPTTSAVDAVQKELDDTHLNDATNTVMTGPYGHAPWVYALQRLAATEAAPFRVYNAANSGRGWAADLSPILSGYINALIGYNPEVVIALGSVNDQNGGSAPAALVADTKAVLTQLIDGCSNLRRILFVETFPGYKGAASYQKARYLSQIAQYRAGGMTYSQVSAKGQTVRVEYAPVYGALGGDDYDSRFNLGGHPLAPGWDALTAGATTGNNPHPGVYGNSRIAEIVWPYFRKYVAARAAV